MPKNYNDVRDEYLQFKAGNPDDPTDLPTFAKQMDEIQGTHGERGSAYHDGMLKQANAGVDRFFEGTGLNTVGRAVGDTAGMVADELIMPGSPRPLTPMLEELGGAMPRMLAEGAATTAEVGSGAGIPAAVATWAPRILKGLGYASAGLRGAADTDSLLGGAISAGSLGAANKLLLPAKMGGIDVGGRAENAVTKWLTKDVADIVPETGANVLAETPQLATRTLAQSVLPVAARVGADVATATGVNEATRQAEMSVGPNKVGLTDTARNPLTLENVVGNVAGAAAFAPQAIHGFLSRPVLVPKQVEQLRKWIDTRQQATEAYRGYDWEGPISPEAYHDSFGTMKGFPGLLRDEDTSQFWTPENLGLGTRAPAPDAEKTAKFNIILQTQLDAYKQQTMEGQDQLAGYTKQAIHNLLGKAGEFVTATPEQVVQAMKELDVQARQMPPETVKGFAKFVSDLNSLIDEMNENTATFTDEQKSEAAKGQTWHPEARSSLVTDRLQNKELIPKVTPEWLKEQFSAEFDQSGDPQFAYQVVLQKAANRVLDAVPEGLAKEKAMPTQVETEFSPNVQGAMKANERFIEALNKLPDEVRNDVISRTAEVFSKKPYISNQGNTAGRLVDQVGSWRNAIITAAESYDPEGGTIMVRRGKGKYERTSVMNLVLRDENGDYVWNPATSAVTIGEGGKSTKKVGGKTIPETNIEDLPTNKQNVPDEMFDEAEFRQAMEAEQGGIELKEGELPTKIGVKSGEESLPETAMGVTAPEFTKPENISKVRELKDKFVGAQSNIKKLSDDQLYNVVKRQFQGTSSVGLPTADLLQGFRRKGGLRTALDAAFEYLQTGQVGDSGKKFMDVMKERGLKVVPGKSETQQLQYLLRDFFQFKKPVEGGAKGVEPWLARIGAIVDAVGDKKTVETVLKGEPGKQLISDDVDPVANGLLPNPKDPTTPLILYHGTKSALKNQKVDPSRNYGFTSLSTVPNVADNFGGKATYQVLVRDGKYFDYENPQDVKFVIDQATKNKDYHIQDDGGDFGKMLKVGEWTTIEGDAAQKAIKSLGYDGFYTHEGAKNLHVYKPHEKLVYIPDAQPLKVPKFENLQSLGGSTGAELVQDKKTGEKFVIKKGASYGQAQAEVFADDVYKAAGVPVPKSKFSGNKKIAEYVEGKTLKEFLKTASPDEQKTVLDKIRDGFAMDALLANWDVIGMDMDNIVVDSIGTPWRVDNGGATHYRAQGEKKPFYNSMSELDSMRDPATNESAGAIFGSLTDQQVKEQILKLAQARKSLFDDVPFPLRNTLNDRLDEMVQWASKVKDESLSGLPGHHAQETRDFIARKIDAVLGEQGYSGTIRKLYGEMAVAIALQQKSFVELYSLEAADFGRAQPSEYNSFGRVGVNTKPTPGESGTKWVNRVLGTLAHELTHIDQWVLAGQIQAPDAFSSQRQRHLENMRDLSNVLSPEERQAILETLRDGMVPKEYQLNIKDKNTGRIYGADDPAEFGATVNQLIVGSLLNGKKSGLKTALETLDYGPTEVREFAQGTYRAISDVLTGLKESIANPKVRAEYGKSLPNVNLFATSEAFHAVVNAAREGSMLRAGDKALADAREYISALDYGSGGNPPKGYAPSMWVLHTKDTTAEYVKAMPDFARAMPSESALQAIEDAAQLSGMSARAYDKAMKPGIWARWFYPFQQLMFSMERAGAPLARPVADLALGLESRVKRSYSQMLEPFTIKSTDGSIKFDQDNLLIKKISTEKTGPWRRGVNDVSAWQQENLAQQMFVQDEKGNIVVNDGAKGAKAAWEKISARMSPEDQQVVMSASVSFDKMGQIAALRMTDAVGRRIGNRVSALLMAMNKKMTWDQALDTSGKILQAYKDGNALWLQSMPPQQLQQLDSLLAGPTGLLAKFKEVSDKLMSRPGFRTESLPGDWIVQFKKPGATDLSYLSADTEHKANFLARKLTNEGNAIVGEIVHKADLRNYTDFDSPDVLLSKFTEIERDVWSRFVADMEKTHGVQVAEDLKEYTPGASTLKELSTKGLNKYLVERQSKVDRQRYDYIDGAFAWASRLATSMEYQAARQTKDLILADPRARAFPSFKTMVNPHFDNLMEPTSQLAKEIKTFASAYMMGGSLASAVINGTQSLTTLVPTLIQLGTGGPARAYKKLFTAMADATSVTMDAKWQGVARVAETKDPSTWTLEESKAALYKRNVVDGGINHGIIQDNIFSGTDQRSLMTAKFGHGDYGPVTFGEMARNAVYTGSQLSLKPFGWVEAFNNKISLMAGVEQGYEKGLRGDALYDHAKLVKTLSTFGGGKANAPGLVPKLSTPYTRSAVGVVNTLQQYGYGVVATYGQLLKDSLGKSPGLTPVERRQAVKALGTMLTTQVALGGALGLPFAAATLTALEKVFGIPANQAVRQGLASLGSDEDQGAVIAETALNGLGNQMFGLDVSSRLGVSNLLGTSAYRGFNLSDMFGPVGSIVGNAAEALNLFGQRQPEKAMKALVPVMFKNTVQLADTKAKYGDYGIRDSSDRLLYNPSPSEAALFAVGFRPARLSQRRAAATLMQAASERGQMQRGRELDNLGQSLLGGDGQSAFRYAQDLRASDPTVNPQDVLRSIVSRAVDSTTERDLLASGSSVSEQDRSAIARTFPNGVVNRQSELQRTQLAAQLGAQVGLPTDPKAFQRAALVDALIQQKGMPRSQALRLVEFLQ